MLLLRSSELFNIHNFWTAQFYTNKKIWGLPNKLQISKENEEVGVKQTTSVLHLQDVIFMLFAEKHQKTFTRLLLIK